MNGYIFQAVKFNNHCKLYFFGDVKFHHDLVFSLDRICSFQLLPLHFATKSKSMVYPILVIVLLIIES